MASRKRRVITLEQKLKIIDDSVKERKSQRLVGDIHGVPKSTVGRIEGKLRSTRLRAIVLPLLRRDASSEKQSSRSWRRHATAL